MMLQMMRNSSSSCVAIGWILSVLPFIYHSWFLFSHRCVGLMMFLFRFYFFYYKGVSYEYADYGVF
jgi:hypothetical protein